MESPKLPSRVLSPAAPEVSSHNLTLLKQVKLFLGWWTQTLNQDYYIGSEFYLLFVPNLGEEIVQIDGAGKFSFSMVLLEDSSPLNISERYFQ